MQENVSKLTEMATNAGWDKEVINQLNGMLDDAVKRRETEQFATDNVWASDDYDWGGVAESTPVIKEVKTGGMSLASGGTQGEMSKNIQTSLKVFGNEVKPVITQRAGAKHPRYNNISGGINRGTDFAVPPGTPVFLPRGEWKVEESFGGAPDQPNASVNNGYGNSVQARNTQTGELIRLSHLSRVGVKAGQIISGGSLVGLSGQSGHVTGPHLDVEYIDTQGRLRDILSSEYAGDFGA